MDTEKRAGLVSRQCAAWVLFSLQSAVLGTAPTRAGVPILFEPNRGQLSHPAQFIARSSSSRTSLLISPGGGLAIAGPPASIGAGQQVQLEFVGNARRVNGSGESLAASITNFYSAERGSYTGIPNYQAVRFADVYPGVDVRWCSRGEYPEIQFIVSPGADHSGINLRFSGNVRPFIDRGGALVAAGPGGVEVFRLSAPQAWDEVGLLRRIRSVRYRIHRDAIRIEVRGHDPHRRLIIDPVLSLSTRFGGTGSDEINAVATDAVGDIYVAGATDSPTFSETSAGSQRSTRRAFVSKLSADGRSLIYTTIFGGSGSDAVRAMAVTAGGEVYVAGVTAGAFPVTAGAYRTSPSGGEDGFVTGLSVSGAIVFSTYLGAAGRDFITSIGVDSSRTIWVGGYTSSFQFPVTAGAYQTTHHSGYSDGFVARLSSGGAALIYSTLLGGAGNDVIYGLSVNTGGKVCIAGSTDSADFPVKNCTQCALNRNSDAFAGCLNTDGTTWDYLTYLGGSGADSARSLVVDEAGNAFVAGETTSSDFPWTAGTRKGGYDAFVVKLSPAGARAFSIVFGGRDTDSAQAITLDDLGRPAVAGFTLSGDFPVGGSGRPYAGGFDAFLARLSADGASVVDSSCFGGSGDDSATAIASSITGTVVAGTTASVDVPTTPSALRTAPIGSGDGFVTRWTEPFAMRMSPASGTGAEGALTFSFNGSSGTSSSVSEFLFLINGGFSGKSACEFDFVPPNQLRILNDTGTAWSAPVPAGSNAVLANGQCSANIAGVSASDLGDRIQLTMPLQFSSAFGGSKTVYAIALDRNGQRSGWQTVGTWTLPVTANQPPSVSVAPASGSGVSAVFLWTATDPNGGEDVRLAQFLISAGLQGVNACFGRLDRNQIYLLNDAGTVWIGPAAMGSTALLTNSQCTLDPAGATRTVTPTGTTWSVPISFASSFVGEKTLSMRALDQAGADSGWQTVGGWTTTPSQPPSVISVSPSSGTGRTQTFSFAMSDPNGAQDVRAAIFLFAGSFSGVSACETLFDAVAGSLYLLNDSGSTWLGPSAIGSGAALQNAQCTLHPSSSSITLAGTKVTVALPMTFAAGFSGNKNVYMFAQDASSYSSGWSTVGLWRVP